MPAGRPQAAGVHEADVGPGLPALHLGDQVAERRLATAVLHDPAGFADAPGPHERVLDVTEVVVALDLGVLDRGVHDVLRGRVGVVVLELEHGLADVHQLTVARRELELQPVEVGAVLTGGDHRPHGDVAILSIQACTGTLWL